MDGERGSSNLSAVFTLFVRSQSHNSFSIVQNFSQSRSLGPNAIVTGSTLGTQGSVPGYLRVRLPVELV